MNPALFSSTTPEWETPQWLFDALNARFSFTLDVCAQPCNAKCLRYIMPEADGLSVGWLGERCWMNPPYGREIVEWVAKARQEADRGALVVGLLPARTDARWWQEHVQGHADVRFVKGRLKFGNAKSAAPFVTLVVAPIPHYDVPMIATESIFVGSRHRKTGAGLALLRAAEEHAKNNGIHIMQVSAPLGGRFAKVMSRQGYDCTNVIFTKRFSHE